MLFILYYYYYILFYIYYFTTLMINITETQLFQRLQRGNEEDRETDTDHRGPHS